jgi:ketosteroid isomerase-like protein
MTDERFALLDRIYAEWGRGDYSSGDFLHPEYELIFADGFLDTGVYKGWAEAWRGWKGWIDQWESWTYVPTDYRELDDGRILVSIDMTGVNRRTGILLESASANVWEFEDGLVRRLTLYAHVEDAERDLDLDKT